MRISGGRGDGNEHVLDQLSAYLDYELPDAERTRVRDHLRRCPACENELATLKATKQLLTEVPMQSLPRSFILTPDMVGRAMSGPVERRRSFGWTLAGRLSTATALVAVLLVLVLSGDVLNRTALSSSGAVGLAGPSTANPGALPSGADNFTTESSQPPVAMAAPTSTTAAASAAASGAAPAPEPPALALAPGTVAAAAAPTETSGLATGANDTTAQSRLVVTAPLTTNYAVSPTDGQGGGVTNSSDAHTKSAEQPAGPLVSGWQLTEGALLLVLVILGIGALWARARGV